MVVELVLGILIGPQVLDCAHVDTFTTFLSNLGLAMLFFFAGYEIDFERIRGIPLRLGAIGWIASLLIAHALAAVLWIAGMIDAAGVRRLRDVDDRHRDAAADPARRR